MKIPLKNLKKALSSLSVDSVLVLVVVLVAVILIILLVKPAEKELREPGPIVKLPDVAKPITPPKGRIAIIIDDFGYNFEQYTRSFLDFDAQLTFAVIPGHNYSQRFATAAAKAGFEVMIHMPMETLNGSRGEKEYVLKTTMTSAEIERRVKKAMAELPEARGMNNHQGSRATQDSRLITIVATILKQTGKYFIDSRTTAESVAEARMRDLGVLVNSRHVFLDNESDPELIKIQIGKLCRRAEKNGQAVGIAHDRAGTLAVLKQEIPRIKAEGFELVFASEIVE